VLGNTTNLAARLQELTRAHDAWVMIDAATWEKAGGAARGFEPCPALPIRGRREPVDAYLLRRRPDAEPPGAGRAS
jgi:class 3 adenylate cyclase